MDVVHDHLLVEGTDELDDSDVKFSILIKTRIHLFGPFNQVFAIVWNPSRSKFIHNPFRDGSPKVTLNEQGHISAYNLTIFNPGVQNIASH